MSAQEQEIDRSTRVTVSDNASQILCEEVKKTILRFALEHTKILGAMGGSVLIHRFNRLGISVVVFKNANRVEICTNKECDDFGIAALPGTRLL